VTDVVCYYHDPVKAPLLRDAVLPALAAVQAANPGLRGHLERHWLHGPHVRIRLDGPGAEAAAELVAARLRAHLADDQSTVDIPEPELRAQAESAGVAELILPPYDPFYPNKSVRIEPSDAGRTLDVLPSAAVVALRDLGLRLGLPAVREFLAESDDAGDTSQARVRLTVSAMAVHASHYRNGLRYGYHSFLSHLEDFLLAVDHRGDVRARFDRIWAANAETVTSAVQRVADGRPTDCFEAAWQTWTTGLRDAAESAYDRGELTPDNNPAYGERAYLTGDLAAIRRYNPAERVEFSDYHHRMSVVDMADPRIERPITAYRFGTNVLYQLLKICDVTPMERYLAASMVANAVQRITGTTWSEQIAAMPRVR
jgi:hypothetical protein